MNKLVVPQFDKLNLPDSIEEFFTKEEYANLCDYERKRLQNMRRNYEMMVYVGLPAIKPDFMRPNRSRKRKRQDPFSTESDSDDEWLPRSKHKSGRKGWCPPFQGPDKIAETDSKKSKKKAQKKKKRRPRKKEETRVYTFRKRKETNYMKLEVPDDDEFLYCEECNQEHDGDCPVHGPLLFVDDIPCPQDKSDPDRAMKTVPAGLEVKESGIPNAGLGVWSTKFFPVRSRFGPYEGTRVLDPDKAHSSGYCWQVCTDGKPSHFVDAKDPSMANWMRYVNCARTVSEQNVTAYQYCGQIYYRAHCDIPAGTELLVWYGAEYGLELGIKRDDKDRKQKQPDVIESIEEDESDSSDEASTESSSDGAAEKRNAKTVKRQPLPRISHTQTKESHSSNNGAAGRIMVPFTPRRQVKTDFDMEKKYSCNECGLSFVELGSFRIHCKHTHGILLQRSYGHAGNSNMVKQNDGLKQSLVDRDGINNSSRDNTIHTGDKPYVCKQCDARFNRYGNLKRHMRIHTGDKPYVCKQCDARFTESGDLKKHMRIHTGDKPYVCRQCDARFTESGHLKTHMRIHTGDKPYVCKQCDARFNQSSTLKTHMRIHTGDKPYVCKQCDARFNQSSTLKTHIRIHTGDKPYVCKQCDARFTDSGNLKTHMRIHTGDKPYVCKQCDARFCRSGILKTHMLTHTGDKPYACEKM